MQSFFRLTALVSAFLLLTIFGITSAFAETDGAGYSDCESSPRGGRAARTEREGEIVIMFILLLEKQGRDKPQPEFIVEGEPCIAETFRHNDVDVSMITPGFQKGQNTLYYKIRIQGGGSNRDLLVLYNGLVSFVSEKKGFYFSVSETVGSKTDYYEIYRGQPTHRVLKALVRNILDEKAAPLMAAEWQDGEDELVIVTYDSDKIK